MLITVDYFDKGKNLFPTSGATQKHLGQLLIELQKATGNVGFKDQIVSVGVDCKYTQIQDALAEIDDSSASKPYVLQLGPETYTEEVTLKPYVFLIGAGRSRTKLSGRIVGPSTGVAGIFGLDIVANTAVPAVDVAAGTLLGDEISIQQTGAGRAFRVTGGALNIESLEILDGPFQVTGGEVNIGHGTFKGIAGTEISAGLVRVEDWVGIESAAGFQVTQLGGLLVCGRIEVTNDAGDYFSISGGTFEYLALFVRSILASGLVLRATGGTVRAGLRNWALGVQATAAIKIADNDFDTGDMVEINGIAFQPGVQFVVGATAALTAAALKEAIDDSLDTAIAGQITTAIDGGDATRILLTAVRPGTAGQAITLEAVDGETENFTLTAFSGGSGHSQIAGATVSAMQLGL